MGGERNLMDNKIEITIARTVSKWADGVQTVPVSCQKDLVNRLIKAISAAQQDEKQFCPYCKKVHNLMLACPEYKDFVEWRNQVERTAQQKGTYGRRAL